MKKQYNKLVRDKIPTIINNNGGKCEYVVLSDKEYKQKLQEKLLEEVHEYLENPSLEELADISEVLLAILYQRGDNLDTLTDARIKKMNERGRFHDRIMLLWSDDNK